MWEPITNWREIDEMNTLRLLEATVDGRAYTIPDPENRGCVLLRYTCKPGEDHESGGDFGDEWMEMMAGGLVNFDDDGNPYATDDGKEHAAAELFKLEILQAAAEGRVRPAAGHRRGTVYTYEPADGDQFAEKAKAFDVEGLLEDDLVSLGEDWGVYPSMAGYRRLQLFGMRDGATV